MQRRFLSSALTVALLTACTGDRAITAPDAPGLAVVAGAVLDISGVWNYVEESILVGRPASEIVRLECLSPDGVLTITQTGSTFTGTLVHPTGSCETADGFTIPPLWSLPYHAVITGTITGNALHIDQFDAPPGPPVHCPKNGTITVVAGAVVALTTVGRCDLSFSPFRPATAKNSATATRP